MIHTLRLFLCLIVLGWGAAVAAAELAASVVFATGITVIIGTDGVSRPAIRGGEIKSGEIIETSAEGRAQLRFRDGASMSLQPNTRFRIDDYRFSGGDSAAAEDRGFFGLIKGGFRTISGLIGKARREQYRVSTTIATIGIRGTEYSASLEGDSLSVSTVAGLVEVCTRAGCVLVKPGDTAIADRADNKPRIKGEQMPGDAGKILPQLPPPASEPDVGAAQPQAPPPPSPSRMQQGPSTAPMSSPYGR